MKMDIFTIYLIFIGFYSCNDSHHPRFICFNCLRGFRREESLENHKPNCYEFHKLPEFVPKRPIYFAISELLEMFQLGLGLIQKPSIYYFLNLNKKLSLAFLKTGIYKVFTGPLGVL